MNKTILVLGAGRSSGALIAYLLKSAPVLGFRVRVGDVSLPAARERVGAHSQGEALAFDILQEENSAATIAQSDVVISLLPATLHPLVARHCLVHRKHLITASYVSEEMKALHHEAAELGLLFLNECGLDPGIDHMSAMEVIHKIQSRGGTLTSFESFTGGLIAPETDPQNPWRYKFTWNPRNVVMAGQGTAKYLQNRQYKYIPYQQLFTRITPVTVPGYGEFEGYANRDSLKYLETYGLSQVTTMLRGTLRFNGYCEAWNIFVQLGCCDDSYQMDHVNHMTHASFLDAFLPYAKGKSVEEKMCERFGFAPGHPAIERLRWSGFFSAEPVGLSSGTPAQVMEHILSKRWKLHSSDKDMIVMWHRFRYTLQGQEKEIQSSLVVTGEDDQHTAMAKTVGLPMGIAAILLLKGQIRQRGVSVPVTEELYQPILTELKRAGIEFRESEP
jgi:saccharopine dehydrogenase (NADP+, L-glutamate forming)